MDNNKGFSAPILIFLLVILFALGITYYKLNPSKFSAPVENTKPTKNVKVGIIHWVGHLKPMETGFKEAMTELGYIEGKDISYESKSGDGDPKKANAIAKEYISNNVDLIFALTPPAIIEALKETTASGKLIPVVYASGDYPIELGYAKSYRSSGNNTTGIAIEQIDLTSKRLQFLKDMNPKISKVGVFASNSNYVSRKSFEAVQSQATKFGFTVVEYKVTAKPENSPAEIQAIANKINPGEIDAIFSLPDPVVNFKDNPKILISLGKRLKIPTAMLFITNVQDGALFAYNTDLIDNGKQVAIMADKIIKGAKPTDIPIEFPRKNSLVVNLKTANEIGIAIPSFILSIASQKIEQ
jgi:putative tryptophan/tyrosine transport system substrate-binding protein